MRDKKRMKSIAKFAAILLAAATCAAWPALAQTDTTPPVTNAPPAAPKPKAQGYQGTIASIDSATMTLTLKARGANPESKVKVTSTTKIYKDRQKTPGLFSDLAEGTRIRGSGKKDDDGVWTANTLYIVPKPAAPTPPPAATTPPPQ
jgi:hypothetical protein